MASSSKLTPDKRGRNRVPKIVFLVLDSRYLLCWKKLIKIVLNHAVSNSTCTFDFKHLIVDTITTGLSVFALIFKQKGQNSADIDLKLGQNKKGQNIF